MKTRPLKFSDPALLEKKIDAYFEHCTATQDPRTLRNGDIRIRQEQPTMIGLAVWLGCSRDTLYSLAAAADGEREQYGEEYSEQMSDIIVRARDRIEQATLQAALVNDVDPRIAGLVLARHGYSSRTEEDQTVTIRVAAASPVDVDAWSK